MSADQFRSSTTSRLRLGAQPVSWGINYLPNWGRQLPAETILSSMSSLGFAGTEYQPGLFPERPEEAVRLLDAHDLSAVAGWVPVQVLRTDRREALEDFRASAEFVRALGAEVVTLGAGGHDSSFRRQTTLEAGEWPRVLSMLDDLVTVAEEVGVRLALHPHVGTAVETPESIDRVLQGSSINFCLDTGHVFCGGGDPIAIARDLGERIAHLHLKDVDATVAERLQSGHLDWPEAIGAGLFVPLGDGDLDTDDLLHGLLEAGYDGWLVIEQDIRLLDDRTEPEVAMDRSLRYLRHRIDAQSTRS